MRMICDAMSLSGFLKAQDEQDTDLRFTYRTLSPLERAEFQERLRNIDTLPEREMLGAKLCAAYVKSWDQTYPKGWPEKDKDGKTLDGKPVPITTEVMIHNVHPGVFTRLYNIITGVGVPDPDPKSPVSKQIDLSGKGAMKPDSLSKLLDKEEGERLGN